MTTLWSVVAGKLKRLSTSTTLMETQLENWLASDPSIVGLDILLIGRQVSTDYGGRIDLLGINREGDLTVIELKRDRTPREVIAQILDYGSWVSKLTTKRVHDIALAHLKRPLSEAFRNRFDTALPETLNGAHSMVVVAASLDASSKRIVEYLADEFGVNINTAFFNWFEEGGQQFLTADWLMDQEEVETKAASKTKAPWTGAWYANVGHGPERSWNDMKKFGFLSAGGGTHYSRRLEQLGVGDPVYAYQKKAGYVGFGHVLKPVAMAKDVLIDGVPLLSLPLEQINFAHDRDDPELAEYVVKMDWKKIFSIDTAKTFDGAFANQNIVCKLRDTPTLDFLKANFG